ncbi:MAG: hypothetical protein MI725_12035 [Pirellulales bacterium]|nr:hypothetical protein [Pirellulales bacterium]
MRKQRAKYLAGFSISLMLFGIFAGDSSADVVVLTNQTSATQFFTLLPASKESRSMSLAAGDSRPVFFEENLRIRFGRGLSQQSFQLLPGNAYLFAQRTTDGALQLERIGLSPQGHEETAVTHGRNREVRSKVIVPVKLLVDDDEPTHRRIWEPRLRKRLADAAKVLEEHSGVSFRVVSVETWESADSEHDFSRTLREFERKVKPQPAALAIGFSSQYRIQRGRVHMGGTRGPLYPYILLKERAPNVLETERLELLVHELGHFLAASHSPEPHSVMRPLLTGGLQRRQGARIQFDPANTLLMALVGDELRGNGARSVNDFSRSTRKRMLEIYTVLSMAMPDDPAAAHYQKLIRRASSPPLFEDTRLVLRQLVRAAQAQRQHQPALKADALTDYYVRQAATTALQVDGQRRSQAFLLAMGIFVDSTSRLRTFPPTAGLVQRVESELERRQRIRVLGVPTLHNRQDLVKHFFVSAHSLVVMGSAATRGAGLAKEILDAQGGSGFSFPDMAANRAGVVFAERLLAGKLSLEKVARSFRSTDYMPEITDLEEGFQADALQDRLSGTEQHSLAEELDRIEQRILQLPAYSDKPSPHSD